MVSCASPICALSTDPSPRASAAPWSPGQRPAQCRPSENLVLFFANEEGLPAGRGWGGVAVAPSKPWQQKQGDWGAGTSPPGLSGGVEGRGLGRHAAPAPLHDTRGMGGGRPLIRAEGPCGLSASPRPLWETTWRGRPGSGFGSGPFLRSSGPHCLQSPVTAPGKACCISSWERGRHAPPRSPQTQPRPLGARSQRSGGRLQVRWVLGTAAARQAHPARTQGFPSASSRDGPLVTVCAVTRAAWSPGADRGPIVGSRGPSRELPMSCRVPPAIGSHHVTGVGLRSKQGRGHVSWNRPPSVLWDRPRARPAWGLCKG